MEDKRSKDHSSSHKGIRDSLLLPGEDDRMALAETQLTTCQTLVQVLGSAVAILSEAGSSLQRCMAQEIDGIHIDTHMASEDALMACAGSSLLGACKGIGILLIGFAATLSSEVAAPLRELHTRLEDDSARRREELRALRQQEMNCSQALTESQQRQDKARAGLQGAIQDQERGKKKSSGWLFKSKDKDGEAHQANKLQKAANQQAAAVEELALRTDEAMLARLQAEKGAKEYRDALDAIDVARKNVIHTSLRQCAAVWEEAANSLQSWADQFRGNAPEPRRKGSGESIVAAASAARAKVPSLGGDKPRGEATTSPRGAISPNFSSGTTKKRSSKVTGSSKATARDVGRLSVPDVTVSANVSGGGRSPLARVAPRRRSKSPFQSEGKDAPLPSSSGPQKMERPGHNLALAVDDEEDPSVTHVAPCESPAMVTKPRHSVLSSINPFGDEDDLVGTGVQPSVQLDNWSPDFEPYAPSPSASPSGRLAGMLTSDHRGRAAISISSAAEAPARQRHSAPAHPPYAASVLAESLTSTAAGGASCSAGSSGDKADGAAAAATSSATAPPGCASDEAPAARSSPASVTEPEMEAEALSPAAHRGFREADSHQAPCPAAAGGSPDEASASPEPPPCESNAPSQAARAALRAALLGGGGVAGARAITSSDDTRSSAAPTPASAPVPAPGPAPADCAGAADGPADASVLVAVEPFGAGVASAGDIQEPPVGDNGAEPIPGECAPLAAEATEGLLAGDNETAFEATADAAGACAPPIGLVAAENDDAASGGPVAPDSSDGYVPDPSEDGNDALGDTGGSLAADDVANLDEVTPAAATAELEASGCSPLSAAPLSLDEVATVSAEPTPQLKGAQVIPATPPGYDVEETW